MAKAPSVPGVTELRLVRTGDQTTLYQGRQERFDRPVAVKAFSGRDLDGKAGERFERECQAMGNLSVHPGVVTFFDSGYLKRKQPYVVTEWLIDGTLQDQLDSAGAPGWRAATDIAVKLAGALESAHRAGVLHRNLKPDNVFVSALGEPLLGDFEVVASRPFDSRGGDPRAAQLHAAPELFTGADPDAASEVYALASVAYTLVLGRPPFVENDEEPIARAIARAASEAPPDLAASGVPPALVQVLRAAIAGDRSLRPQTAAELGRLLRGAQTAAGEPATRLALMPETDEDRAQEVAPSEEEPPAAPTADETPAPPAEEAPAAEGPAPPAAREPAARASDGEPPTRVGPVPLVHQVRELLGRAAAAYDGRVGAGRLNQVLEGLDRPLQVAIAGRVKAGKSTLLNALVGQELAPTDASECTRIPTWYIDGVSYRATIHIRDGAAHQVPISREQGAVDVELGDFTAADIERIVIEWPSSALSELTLVDTPGIGSASGEVSARTEAALIDGENPVDAVLYLIRHFHPNDARFLEAFHDDSLGATSPVNAIAVLSRADEIGGGQTGALVEAATIATRYEAEPQMRQLCQVVVPVAGLLAQSGAVLRQEQFDQLEALAQLPEAAVGRVLVSADRFVAGGPELVGTTAGRRELLKRFGLFGVRAALEELRRGRVATADDLARALVDASGLHELREILMTQFASRRDVLKSRAALGVLRSVLAEEAVPDAEALEFELERITAGAHELIEIDLLSAHRSGEVTFEPDETDEVDRLLGARGATPATRLGLADDASPTELRAALVDTVHRWRQRAEHPLTPRAVADGARVLIRTCEGILAELDPELP